MMYRRINKKCNSVSNYKICIWNHTCKVIFEESEYELPYQYSKHKMMVWTDKIQERKLKINSKACSAFQFSRNSIK